MSRDPIEEEGGWNLYVFINNSPINGIDYGGTIAIADDIAAALSMLIATVAVLAYPSVKDMLDSIAKAIPNLSNPTCPSPRCKDLKDAINQKYKDLKGDQKNIDEHIEKLNQYKRDPLPMDNLNTLRNALDNKNYELVKKIYEGRIKALEDTINKHMKNLQTHLKELEDLINLWHLNGC